MRRDTMKRFTVNVPEKLKKKMNKMSSVNWSEIAKEGILRKLNQLEKLEQIANKGEL